jgi:hypothetical protein
MVESINAAAGDDLEKGCAGEAAVAEPSAAGFSLGSFLCWYIPRVSAISQRRSLASRRRPYFQLIINLSFLLQFILSLVILWLNIQHLLVFGPWSALAFFVLQTVPLIVLLHLCKPAPQDEEENQMMPRPPT